MTRIRSESFRLGRWSTLGAAAATVGLLLLSGDVGAEEKRCKGTKQFYSGKCRYPDEIARMQAEDQRRRDAATEAMEKAAEQQRQKEEEERRAQDAKACVAARKAGSIEAWRGYLSEHPEGMCEAEALSTIKRLEDEPPEPEPEPLEPEPGPEPDGEPEPAAAGEGGWLGLHPLAWVGFGLTAAGGITWGVAGGISLARTSDLEETCPNNTCSPESESDLDDANLAAHVTTVGAVVTAVGAAVAVTGLLLPVSSSNEAQAETASHLLEWQPVVGLGSVGLVGRF